MRIKKIAKNGFAFFLVIWISATYAQKNNVEKRTNTTSEKTNKDKLAAIEKVCQTIIDEKDDNHFIDNSSDADTSISSSDINLLKVFGDISSELQNGESNKLQNTENKNQFNTVQTIDTFYSKEKFETLIAHSNSFIRKMEFLSQTLHKKADEFESILKMNKFQEQKMVFTKLGQAFLTMAGRLDYSIKDLQKTQPFIVETYTKMTAISNEMTANSNNQLKGRNDDSTQLELAKNLVPTIEATKSLYGVALYLAAIKKCNTTVSKIQEDLVSIAKASGSSKN